MNRTNVTIPPTANNTITVSMNITSPVCGNSTGACVLSITGVGGTGVGSIYLSPTGVNCNPSAVFLHS